MALHGIDCTPVRDKHAIRSPSRCLSGHSPSMSSSCMAAAVLRVRSVRGGVGVPELYGVGGRGDRWDCDAMQCDGTNGNERRGRTDSQPHWYRRVDDTIHTHWSQQGHKQRTAHTHAHSSSARHPTRSARRVDPWPFEPGRLYRRLTLPSSLTPTTPIRIILNTHLKFIGADCIVLNCCA